MLFDAIVDCREWIEAALAHENGEHTFDDVARGIMTGRFHLWQKKDACAVTEFVRYPQATMCNVFLAGGNLATIKAAIPEVEAFAKENGCAALSLSGRRGWVRELQHSGWTEAHTTMIKDLKNG